MRKMAATLTSLALASLVTSAECCIRSNDEGQRLVIMTGSSSAIDLPLDPGRHQACIKFNQCEWQLELQSDQSEIARDAFDCRTSWEKSPATNGGGLYEKSQCRPNDEGYDALRLAQRTIESVLSRNDAQCITHEAVVRTTDKSAAILLPLGIAERCLWLVVELSPISRTNSIWNRDCKTVPQLHGQIETKNSYVAIQYGSESVEFNILRKGGDWTLLDDSDGRSNGGYLERWQNSVTRAIASGLKVIPQSDLVSPRQSLTAIDWIHRWALSAALLLNEKPFDSNGGWYSPASTNARLWMSRVELANGEAAKGTVLRAECAEDNRSMASCQR